MTEQYSNYIIIIKQHLRNNWGNDLFPGFSVKLDFDENDQPVTVFTGTIQDQAELFGILMRLSNLNLQLVSINKVSDDKN